MRKILFIFLILSLIVYPLYAGGNRWTSKPPIGSTINWSHPLSKGLVGCWLMNEGVGNIVKDIARENNGILINTLWVSSQKYISTYYNNSSSYISCGNSLTLQLTNTVTIGCYVNLTTLSTGSSPDWTDYIVSKGNDSTAGVYALQHTGSASGRRNFSFMRSSTAGTRYWANTPSNYNFTGIFYFVVGVDNGKVLKIYINGIFMGENTSVFTRQANTSDNFEIGRSSGNTYYSNAKITNVIVYNRALSPQEIQQLYQEPYCFINPPTIWSNFSTAVAGGVIKTYNGLAWSSVKTIKGLAAGSIKTINGAQAN